MHVVVVGAGIFGVNAALELRARGHEVTLTDPGPIPHPLAESTDISKAVRMDYGADDFYAAAMERALAGWRAWNARWPTPLFHEDGVTYLSRAEMAPGGFEHDSFEVLRRRGHRVERLRAADIRARFPEWNAERFVDGYYNPQGGYAESGKVVAALADEAARAGVVVRGGVDVAEVDGSAVVAKDGTRLSADRVVVAAGSWAPLLVPELAPCLRAVGQPVFHLAPRDPSRFRPAVFPTFGADIAKTGYYGFPANADGLVKIANHGPGRVIAPDARERAVTKGDEAALRAFLRDAFPGLAVAPIVATRLCVYCDTYDEHFWIAPSPARAELVVATGGSGHAFKFAPVLGAWIADAVEGKGVVDRFRWREDLRAGRGEEAARHHG